MIPGYSGRLLPDDYVGQWLGAPGVQARGAGLHRDLRRLLPATRTLGPASSLRAMTEVCGSPLAAHLGFRVADTRVGDRCALLTLRSATTSVALVVTPWGTPLRRAWRDGVVHAQRTGAGWALLTNGQALRLISATRVHSRRFTDIDLAAAAADTRTASAMALLMSAEAVDGWSPASGVGGLAGLVAGADSHAAHVCRMLQRGVLDAASHILGALGARDRRRPIADVHEQALTVVFRLLFLFFAEARALVPMWHPIYRESYSMEALREAALGRDVAGLWDGLRAAARLAHAGCRAGTLVVTPFNGRLFSPARTPLAERRGLDDDAARRAIVAVSTRPAPDGEGREPVAYQHLGVEQLGAVYETLLDYTPHIEPAARGGAPRATLQRGGDTRKTSGSFYTPQPLVDYVLRDALWPLVHEASPEQILSRRVLDPAMGSGAVLVGACRYLASAYEAALVAHGRCHPGDIGPAERASVRRLVAERCLFGVDLNPAAVQLARLSLWLTTLAADRPLTFLDHHLRVGNSLAGAWLSRLRTPPVRRRAAAPLPLFPDDAVQDVVRTTLPTRFRLAFDPNDTVQQVREKERMLAALTADGSPLAKWTTVANLWCAAWLAAPPVPATAFADLADAVLTGGGTLPRTTVRSLLDRVAAAAAAQCFFHWELEFPEVFFSADGARRPDAGFDAVVGNPPWDMVRADGAGDRAQARAEAAATARFVRESGMFDVPSDGQINRYQLFVERAVSLTKPGGRLGLIVPSGLLSDAASASLRRLLFSRCTVERLTGFDNRLGTFPVHRSVRFIVLSAAAGGRTSTVACRFGETDTSALEHAASPSGAPARAWFPLHVSTSLLHTLSGDDLAVPDLRTPTDLTILERAASLFPPLGSAQGWGAQFGRELNATEDAHMLTTAPADATVPVFEGKMIDSFRADSARARWHMSEKDAAARLGARWLRPRLAYRDVASATNRTTLIAAVLPGRSVSTHTLFCLKTALPLRQQHLLCALLNSFVVNYFVRRRVTTHVTTAIVERLPVPSPADLGPWAEALADDGAALARGMSDKVLARVNARVAALYQLSGDEFTYVLDTFPLVDRALRDLARHAFEAL